MTTQTTGIMYQLPTVTTQDNAASIRTNALTYERYKGVTVNPEIVSELHDYINRSFRKLPVPVQFVDIELTCEDMRRTYHDTHVLAISSLHNNSDLFPGLLNLKFRAIHDYVHLTKGYACNYEGEYRTFLEQSRGLSYGAKQVLFSEIVLQACYCLYFGAFPEKQKVVLINLY